MLPLLICHFYFMPNPGSSFFSTIHTLFTHPCIPLFIPLTTVYRAVRLSHSIKHSHTYYNHTQATLDFHPSTSQQWSWLKNVWLSITVMLSRLLLWLCYNNSYSFFMVQFEQVLRNIGQGKISIVLSFTLWKSIIVSLRVTVATVWCVRCYIYLP
jgi:hypothetical protein